VCLTHPAVNLVVALAAAGDDGTAAASAGNEPATPGEREVARVFEVRIHGRGGLDESNALFEARRCLSCGNCFERDNCYGVCPDTR